MYYYYYQQNREVLLARVGNIRKQNYELIVNQIELGIIHM